MSPLQHWKDSKKKMTTPWVSSAINNKNWRAKFFSQIKESKKSRLRKQNLCRLLLESQYAYSKHNAAWKVRRYDIYAFMVCIRNLVRKPTTWTHFPWSILHTYFSSVRLLYYLFLKPKYNVYIPVIGPLCNRPMGIQSGRLKNHMITASSMWDVNHAAYFARLHNRRRGRFMGAWSAKYNSRYQWLQVYFGGAAKIIRISTQGRPDANQWVTQYYITHSLDRVHFSEYKERNSRKVLCDFFWSFSNKTEISSLVTWTCCWKCREASKLECKRSVTGVALSFSI